MLSDQHIINFAGVQIDTTLWLLIYGNTRVDPF